MSFSHIVTTLYFHLFCFLLFRKKKRKLNTNSLFCGLIFCMISSIIKEKIIFFFLIDSEILFQYVILFFYLIFIFINIEEKVMQQGFFITDF